MPTTIPTHQQMLSQATYVPGYLSITIPPAADLSATLRNLEYALTTAHLRQIEGYIVDARNCAIPPAGPALDEAASQRDMLLATAVNKDLIVCCIGNDSFIGFIIGAETAEDNVFVFHDPATAEQKVKEFLTTRWRSALQQKGSCEADHTVS